MDGSKIDTGASEAFVCVISGTVGGLIIGLVTEYYTSFSYAPVREVCLALPCLSSDRLVGGFCWFSSLIG